VESGLTFYDAFYLQPAIDRELTLVTDDGKLYSVARNHVKVLRSEEL
jgi:predicted nucleic acid-binding protein